MLNAVFSLAQPALLAFPPERAHELTLRALELGAFPHEAGGDSPALAVPAMGLTFKNPIGIAAGFDKDARVPDAVLAIGCGFAEIGTTTPRPQAGNPAPRVFRLFADRGIVNRLGFNNGGHAAALRRLEARRRRGGIVGVNIGANKDSANRVGDYVLGLETFNDVASYFTVNISSPNTPGLRDLQAPAALDDLLARVMDARAAIVAKGMPQRPIVVKLAPDIADDDLGPTVAVLVKNRVDGIAVSNTTLARQSLTAPEAREAGGLSGRPLFHRSTVMLARVYLETEGKIPLIGIGGIDSGEAALAKIEAGATLLQLYTGLIYEGVSLIGRIKQRLGAAVAERGAKTLAELTGTRADEWARKPV